MRARWRAAAAPGGLAAAALWTWLAATAWLRPLMLPDEGRYGGVAWEMLRRGDWAVPTLDGMPYFHKPPLFYWLSAGAMRWLGPSEFAVRMPSLLGGLLAALGLYLFTRRWADARHARWAVLLLATQPFFFVGAQFANLDMLVAGCITVTVLLAAHAMQLRASGRPWRVPLAGACASAAVGLLAKGLIGAVLPAAILLGWLLAIRRPRDLVTLAWPPGLMLFLLIGLPWFVAMQQRYSGFFDYFVIYHHVQRFSQGGFNNQQPFWFYGVVIVVLTLPSSLLLPRAWRAWRTGPRTTTAGEGSAPLPLRPLMVSWLAVVVLFFSLPASKLVGYVLPALPPLAWLLADGLLLEPRPRPALRWAVPVLGALASLAAVIALALVPGHSSGKLGGALRTLRQPGDPVVFLDRYPFDLPLYARLEADPVVMRAWEEGSLRDDWRKELSDAGRFAPDLAAARLLPPPALAALLCQHGVAWLVGSRRDLEALGDSGAVAVAAASDRDMVLWRATPQAGSCLRR